MFLAQFDENGQMSDCGFVSTVSPLRMGLQAQGADTPWGGSPGVPSGSPCTERGLLKAGGAACFLFSFTPSFS